MTEYVVKHIGLFAVGDLLGGAEEIGGGKTPVREMLEKGPVRNPAGHRDDLPPRNGFQQRVELSEIGNARLQLAEDIEPIEESAPRIATKPRRLPIEQASPGLMLRSEGQSHELQSLRAHPHAASCCKKKKQ